MTAKLETMITNKMETEALLVVGIEYKCSNMMGNTLVYNYNFENGIYIEGDNITINISADQEYSIEYNELEGEFVIKQNGTVFYLS